MSAVVCKDQQVNLCPLRDDSAPSPAASAIAQRDATAPLALKQEHGRKGRL